jgi:predicted dehydrogenase
VALVSGHADKAHSVADHYGIDRKSIYSYDNFDTIRENKDVDVVYVILPNSMHSEYTIRAANAGKHVLCEKPMCTSVDEATAMIDACAQAGRKLMIAYRLRYEPFNQTMIELARKQAFGKLKTIEAVNQQNVKAPNIRLSEKLGGGPLGDVGVYCINAARYITGEEPIQFTATAFRPSDDPRFAEVDESVAFTMKFPSGVLANCECGFGSEESRRYRIHAADGWFELDPSFAYTGLRLHTKHLEQKSEIQLPHVNHFAAEMDHFSDCVMNEKHPWTPGEEGLHDMIAMEKITQAAREGKMVRV